MKGYKEKSEEVYADNGISLEDFIIKLQDAARGITNPTLDFGWESDILIKGWRPMTEKEKARSKKNSEVAKAAAVKRAAKKEADERAEFERLAKKYG